ncbi:hypothetical protein Desku_0868 [Desulfofundulus kuznetsovii DSM 6115]|jgi:hypothetical protein|uniref:Uncharacterized protein n=1 Tax=Desulfofundulus kuznetsovii (strain DSM 6115 / VKM B-1805 / 17) TaxID=760568 RepID=A0AAU8PX88_DESK7|nr:hypothetical protein Desku_0868 [Desulfofundulus kuznetsovii DSM 6115]
MREVFSRFTGIPVVQGISATTVRGQVKHYNVRVKLHGRGAEEELNKLWPFGNISTDGDGVTADYIVKPEEVDNFYSRLLKVSPQSGEREVAIVFQFSGPLTEELRWRVAKSVRSSDRLIWGDNRVVIVLRNCGEEAVKAVQERIGAVLAANNDVSFSVRVSISGS